MLPNVDDRAYNAGRGREVTFLALGGGAGTGVHPSSVTPNASESTPEAWKEESMSGVTELATALTSLALALAILATTVRRRRR